MLECCVFFFPLFRRKQLLFERSKMKQCSLFHFFSPNPGSVAAVTPALKKPAIAAAEAPSAPPPPQSTGSPTLTVASQPQRSVALRRADAVPIVVAKPPSIVAETDRRSIAAPEGKIADEAVEVNVPSKALSAYERKRNARIARNKVVLANLGLESTKAEMEQERAPKRRRVKTQPPRAKARDAPPPQRRQPSRRSSRVRGIAAAASASSSASLAPDPVTESESEPEPESFDDSDVLRYLASAPVAVSCSAAARAAPAPGATRRFVTPHADDVPHVEFAAESMKKIYSLHWWSPRSASASAAPARGTLLCAAGEKGLVDVFGLDRDEPLASWKAHKGWIATARFVGAESGDAAEGELLADCIYTHAHLLTLTADISCESFSQLNFDDLLPLISLWSRDLQPRRSSPSDGGERQEADAVGPRQGEFKNSVFQLSFI